MINVYDFDKTIYDGDSSIDFYLYCLKKKKSIVLLLPIQFFAIFLYSVKLKSKEYMKEKFFSFLKKIDNIEKYVDDFWKENNHKIKNWYHINSKETDIIISASPEFLLNGVKKYLKTSKIIASKIDEKTGEFLEKNCYGKEKINRLNKEYPNTKIENFYSDSYSDLPLMKLAKQSYLVNNDSITLQKIEEKEENINKQKIEKKLFIVSLTYFLIITTLLLYNFDFSETFNLLFDSDTSRIIADTTIIDYPHDRLTVHPLFVIFIQPIIFIISGFVLNKNIALIILTSLVSAISIIYLYRILSTINHKNKKTNLLLLGIYAFSFSNIMFTAGIETYNFSALCMIILTYTLIKQIENKKDTINYLIFSILGVTLFGFTITNYIIFLIAMFVLFISKNVKLKKIVLIVSLSIILSLGLSFAQKLVWHNTPLLSSTAVTEEKNSYADMRISLDKLKNVIKYDYINSLISSDVKLFVNSGYVYNYMNYMINFKELNIINITLTLIFYLLLVIVLIRNFKKNLYINIALSLSLLFNTLLHILYGNETAFLYSLHFLYIIILLFGINFNIEKNNKLKTLCKYFLFIFLLVEIINNNIIFIKILKIIKDVLTSKALIATFGFIITAILEVFIIWLLMGIAILVIKTIKSSISLVNKDKKIILTTISIILILSMQCIFFSLETFPVQKKILWKNIYVKNGDVNPKNKTQLVDGEFKNYFADEIKSLEQYASEYKEFLSNYEHEQILYGNERDYFFFGLGNRRKLAYKKNCILDITTGEKIFEFEEKEHLLVPNEYAVLIETNNKEFIKIYENKNGVYIEINEKKEIIEGTNLKLNLYEFAGQKYQNIKKVLYNEILFNIKDGVIYPNVIVYDKPWYRDAALACMVLKQTNNIDMISNWIENIDEIYDMQNGNIKEPDNLGQLLYMMSCIENKNYELIDKIEKEAERLATNNKNGYYIYGKTDFQDLHLYQNLWYKFGIESLGKKFKFKINNIEEDIYVQTAWWSSVNSVDKMNKNADLNYPYLTFAAKHKGKDVIMPANRNLYPLSWEFNASQANYDELKILEVRLEELKMSPLHTWSASELLLLILDETNDLKM